MAIINLRIEFLENAEADLAQKVKDAVKMLDDRTIELTDVTPWDVIVNMIVGDIDVEYKVHSCEFEDTQCPTCEDGH